MKRLFIFATLLASQSAFAQELSSPDNNSTWTSEQVEKLCHYRTEKSRGNALSFERCLKSHDNRIGKEKQAGDVGELNRADKALDKKVAKRLEKMEKKAKPSDQTK